MLMTLMKSQLCHLQGEKGCNEEGQETYDWSFDVATMPVKLTFQGKGKWSFGYVRVHELNVSKGLS